GVFSPENGLGLPPHHGGRGIERLRDEVEKAALLRLGDLDFSAFWRGLAAMPGIEFHLQGLRQGIAGGGVEGLDADPAARRRISSSHHEAEAEVCAPGWV